MTLRKLFTKTSYKTTFNAIYKEYLKEYSKSKVELFSVNLQRSHDLLKNLPQKECKNIIKVEHIGDTYTINICDEENCSILDFVDWGELIDCELDAPKNISDSKLSGLILWDITFWGFSPDQIRRNKDEINARAIQGKPFLLQDYKNREHRLE
tara:strand:- start:456 stop:914 length:459 start_codon:yes stop_codon:yes gene_type:complete